MTTRIINGEPVDISPFASMATEFIDPEERNRNYRYEEFLDAKAQLGSDGGFRPLWMPDFLFDFQKILLEWACLQGRSAIFADCGLGKTILQLAWAQNVVQKTNGRVLILTPISVGVQTLLESERFGIEAHVSRDGHLYPGINITNYERLHYFDPKNFVGVVCDESSCLKNFNSVRRQQITEFMKKINYRLLCTATAAPNDYIELGTSSEALGALGYTDMLTRFFKNDQHTIRPMVYRNRGNNFAQLEERNKWRFKGHAEIPFWRWVSSWARAIRRPSDIGCDDSGFILPTLTETSYIVKAERLADGFLFPLPAVGLTEQRDERRGTIVERCEKAAELALSHPTSVLWCHLNPEGDLLEKIIPGCVQVSGRDSDEAKEEKLTAFSSGQIARIVTKGKIAGWGLNWQHCAHTVTFTSHSFESYYQSVRRFWRFGQQHPVQVDIVTSEGEVSVLSNMQRKAKAADRMFDALVEQMNNPINIARSEPFTLKEVMPSWLDS